MPLEKWKKLDEKIIFDNGFWQYKLDNFEFNGRTGEYHYMHTCGSTMVIPVSQGNLILVNQYRYLNDKEGLEFPCGAIEGGLSAIENAQKELREETGFMADKLVSAGSFSPFTGACDEICEVFIGLNLREAPLTPDDTEEFEIHKHSPEQVSLLIEKKIIWDGMTIAAWMIAHKTLMKILN